MKDQASKTTTKTTEVLRPEIRWPITIKGGVLNNKANTQYKKITRQFEKIIQDLKKLKQSSGKSFDLESALKLLRLDLCLKSNSLESFKKFIEAEQAKEEYDEDWFNLFKEQHAKEIDESAKKAKEQLKKIIIQKLLTEKDGEKYKTFLEGESFSGIAEYLMGIKKKDVVNDAGKNHFHDFVGSLFSGLKPAIKNQEKEDEVNKQSDENLKPATENQEKEETKEEKNLEIMKNLFVECIKENRESVKKIAKKTIKELEESKKLAKDNIKKLKRDEHHQILLGKDPIIIYVKEANKDQQNQQIIKLESAAQKLKSEAGAKKLESEAEAKKPELTFENPKARDIEIITVYSLQEKEDIQKTVKNIGYDDPLFKNLKINDGETRKIMIDTLKEIVPTYAAERRSLIGMIRGNKKIDQTIGAMMKDVNHEFADRLGKKSPGKVNNIIFGKNLAIVDEDQTEYSYEISKIKFVVPDSAEAKELGFKNGGRIEVKFSDKFGKYRKSFTNIFQSDFNKSGADYEKFKQSRINLAKEMLRDASSYKDNITLYDGEEENFLIDLIGKDVVRNIKNKKFENLGNFNYYNRDPKLNPKDGDDGANKKLIKEVEITITKDNKYGLPYGSKLIVKVPTHRWYEGEQKLESRYYDAMKLIESPEAGTIFVEMKKEGKVERKSLEDFLEGNQNKLPKLPKNIDELKTLGKKSEKLESNFSLYQKNRNSDSGKIEIEKINDHKGVACEMLYKSRVSHAQKA